MTGFDPEIAAKSLIPKEVMAKASSLHLAIHLHPDFVEGAVMDPENREVLWNETFFLEDSNPQDFKRISEFVTLRNWGDRVFRKTSITFDDPDFTLVPHGFLIPGRESEILKFATQRDPEQAESYSISEIGASLLFNLPSEIRKLAARFPNCKFYNSAAFFIKESLRQSKDKSGFHVLSQKGFMLVVACSNGEIKLTNHFGIQGVDDVLYHLANTAMRLEVDLASSNVTLYGKTSDEKLTELLINYVGNVKTAPSHLSYSVLIHFLCA
ncbi:MAG: DUF3822 family protein [Flavobacteriales bacterium]